MCTYSGLLTLSFSVVQADIMVTHSIGVVKAVKLGCLVQPLGHTYFSSSPNSHWPRSFFFVCFFFQSTGGLLPQLFRSAYCLSSIQQKSLNAAGLDRTLELFLKGLNAFALPSPFILRLAPSQPHHPTTQPVRKQLSDRQERDKHKHRGHHSAENHLWT